MGEMKLNMKKTNLLTNLGNKQGFLKMLGIKMKEAKLQAIQSSGHADVLIFQTAIRAAVTRPTVVIGEDTDFLILSLHHINQDCHRIFFTSGQKSRSKGTTKLWDIKHVKSKLGQEICYSILLIHALLDCDTTSTLYSIGKDVALQRSRENTASDVSARFSDFQ